ncbi:CheR family methyltransferase [Yoonia litorea]|uniref:Chemotaxis protein methyltransferase n=1 Tax=Yoonia litorea TaxID=1123755 RepID=A0A1I6MIH8_9RHOB|nr:protein-glutamate O-methyltransferase CheR [Yoonia litorea]SFS15418.1 chemotaxis protein methyltransferase CheR [Yoonia litorea]
MTAQYQPPIASHPSSTDLSDADFETISEIAKSRFGLDLQPSKRPLVHSRLSKRLRALSIDSFAEYCDRLKRKMDEGEEDHLLSALTTNVTHFFREPHHFAFLRDKIAPQLRKRATSGQPIRIWSAACSTGQEAYSIAGTLIDALPGIINQDVRILATDVDPAVIQTARSATYKADQLSQIPHAIRPLLLDGAPSNGYFTIRQEARRLVRFAPLNLMDEWPMRRRFDLIFCRNAAIYFDKPTQSRLWERFAQSLNNQGHLMIGHSERLSGPACQTMKNVGTTTYQKNSLDFNLAKGNHS